MHKLKTITISMLVAAGLYIPASYAETAKYEINPEHTSVIITWNHFGFSHPTAVIPNAKGEIIFDKDDVKNSKVNVTVPVSEIDSHVPLLTKEFKGAEYFDVARYPSATFQSTKVISKGNNQFDVEGNLTIKGTTKPVTLQATLNKQNIQPMLKKPAIGFDVIGTIKRSDFKIDKYVPSVSDEITLTISTEAYSN